MSITSGIDFFGFVFQLTYWVKNVRVVKVAWVWPLESSLLIKALSKWHNWFYSSSINTAPLPELRGKRFRKHRKWCHTYTNYDVIFTPPMTWHSVRKRFLPNSVRRCFFSLLSYSATRLRECCMRRKAILKNDSTAEKRREEEAFALKAMAHYCFGKLRTTVKPTSVSCFDTFIGSGSILLVSSW